jgi:hypothetical protein
VLPTDGYSRDSAYLYGRFYIDGMSPLWYQLSCRDGNKYKIQFSRSSSVKVIKIAPSICQVDYVVFGNATQNQMVGFRLLRNEVLDPGGVYYIGDFTADSTWNWVEGIVTGFRVGRYGGPSAALIDLAADPERESASQPKDNPRWDRFAEPSTPA